MMKGIYKIKSPSGKVYIGQSHNIDTRFKNYKSGCPAQPKLNSSLLKHGFDNHSFTIIHELPNDIDQLTLDTYEDIYLEQYKLLGVKVLNLRNAGSRGLHSDETKNKMKGRVWSNYSIEKIRKSLIGHAVSEYTRKKISENVKKHLSENPEVKLRMSEAKKGRPSNKKGKKIGRIKPYKIMPSEKELQNLSVNNTLKNIGLVYNVSGGTIKDWLKRLNIPYINKPRYKFTTETAQKALLIRKKLNCIDYQA